MPTSQDRILSYQFAKALEDGDLENVSGGAHTAKTIGTQKFVGTKGGDTTIHFDNYDAI